MVNIMKTLALIISIFLPLISFGQLHDLIRSNGKIVVFQNSAITFNSLTIGRVLNLTASSIPEDSLEYNSTSDLVTGSSGVNVDLDGSTQVKIENYVRFGSATTGTIYQIVDTGATAANLVLNLPFTGSVTDEFFCGCICCLFDGSGKNNDAIQPTPGFQPKLLSDNSIYSDGVDDYLYVDDNDNLSFGNGLTDSPFSISIWINIEAIGAPSTLIGKHSEDANTREYKLYYIANGELFFALYDESINAFLYLRNYFVNSHIGSWINITATYDGSSTAGGMKVYVNNDLKSMSENTSGVYVAMENTNVDLRIAGKSSAVYYDGKMDNISIYSRVLNNREIEALYKNSIHYTP